jgi:hypothetical protein
MTNREIPPNLPLEKGETIKGIHQHFGGLALVKKSPLYDYGGFMNKILHMLSYA